MGFSSFLKGATSIATLGIGDKPFRTGRTSAINAAKDAGLAQQELNQELFDLIKPLVEQGQVDLTGAGETVGEFGELVDNLQPVSFGDAFTQAQQSPALSGLVAERQRAADQALSSAGLRRSGRAIQAAAQVPTDVLMGLAQQIFNENQRIQGLGLEGKAQQANFGQNQARIGLGQLGPLSNAVSGIVGGQNAQAQALADKASRKEQILRGLLKAGTSIFSGGAF